MKLSPSLAALLLALPLAAAAQTTTTPAKTTPVPTAAPKTTPATQQVTEVTEELDPATGKVIRRTTRTTTMPAGTAAPAPAPTKTTIPTTTTDVAGTQASDLQTTDFFREKTTVSRLTAPQLLNAYNRFIEKVHEDRQTWKSADWSVAAAVLNSLNARYEQLRSSFSFDDKLTIRSQQAEFQALRTARQLSDQISDKL